MSSSTRIFNVIISEEELNNLVEKILNDLNTAEEKTIGTGVKVITLKLAEASKERKWKYFLDYYPETGRLTVMVKVSERQPERYAILRISSKITNAEEPEKFLERMAKIYLLLKRLEERISVKPKEELI